MSMVKNGAHVAVCKSFKVPSTWDNDEDDDDETSNYYFTYFYKYWLERTPSVAPRHTGPFTLHCMMIEIWYKPQASKHNSNNVKQMSERTKKTWLYCPIGESNKTE